MKIIKGSKNVFRDVGFGKEEAANLLVRSRLMMEVQRYIKSKRITQVEAAKRFGVTQPRVSDLIRGKINLFTTDMLINMLASVGMAVAVHVQRQNAA